MSKLAKTYNVKTTGNVPHYIIKSFIAFDKQPVTDSAFKKISNELNFYVVDCKDAYGNTNIDKEAWLQSMYGERWSISIDAV